YSWFLLHRGDLSILIHPLTKELVKDHTSRSAWIGPSVPLDVEHLPPILKKTPLQYPELGLGYSARTEYLDSNEYAVLEDDLASNDD
ncbi:2231_t:CDS:1, partial [Cetraspora pellucida]